MTDDDDNNNQQELSWEERQRKAMEALNEEAALFELSIEELAEKKLKDAAATAAENIIHIGLTGTEQGKLRANMYIIDRVFGKVTDSGFGNVGKDPIQKLIDKLIDDDDEVPATTD